MDQIGKKIFYLSAKMTEPQCQADTKTEQEGS